VDYRYGNIADARKVGEICKEYGVPFLLNTAYSSGIMPVDGKKLHVILCGSGHKSWAASAPIGSWQQLTNGAQRYSTNQRAAVIGAGADFRKRSCIVRLLSCVRGAVATLMRHFPQLLNGWNTGTMRLKMHSICKRTWKDRRLPPDGSNQNRSLMNFESRHFMRCRKG